MKYCVIDTMLNEINPQRRRHFTCQRQISRAQRISQIRLRIYFVKKYLAVCEIFFWRHHPDLNWGWGFCRPLPYLLAMMPYRIEWCRYFVWSGRRDSDPRLSPWQGDTLPLSHSRKHWLLYQNNPQKATLFWYKNKKNLQSRINSPAIRLFALH